MKIIFVLPNIFSGGAERVVTILSRKLVERKYLVDIVLLINNTIQYDIPQGVDIVKLNTEGMPRIKRVLTLRKYFKQEKQKGKIIVIPFQDSCLKNSLFAKMFLGAPLIACERNNPYRKGSSFLKKIRAQIPFFLSDFCIFQTPDARQYYSFIDDKRCKVICNPISHSDLSWKHVYSEDKMIMVGRLHKQKNYHMLIDAMCIVRESFPRACIHIYGEGELLGTLVAYAKSKNIENAVIFEGRADDITQRLAGSSIFLLSSDFEGISNAMLEALSVGMPIICTDCPIGGARMMLKDDAGILSPVGDAQAFATNIISLLSDQQKMETLGSKAREVANRYTEDKIVDAWEEVFIRLDK